jgi:hypothetical protein
VLVQKVVAGVSEFLNGHGATTPAAVIAKGVVGSMVTTKRWLTAASVGLVGLGLSLGAMAQSSSRPESQQNPAAVGRTAQPNLPPEVSPPREPADQRATGSPKHATRNFVVVYAHSPAIARAVAGEAEYQRDRIAKQWFGAPLPDWDKPVSIRVTHAAASSSGSTTLSLARQSIAAMEMNLNGPLQTVLDSLLPHEVAHTVFASHFGKPLPRWADEGMALIHDSPEEQHHHDVRVRELLNAGRAIRLTTLFPMMEYPKDAIAAYAQGHSVCRFLLAQHAAKGVPVLTDIPYLSRLFPNDSAHRRLLAFLQIGVDTGTADAWDKAARDVYGFKSVDDLERAWILWLATPRSELTRDRDSEKPKDKEPDRIPPTELPLGPGRSGRP